MGGLCTQSVDQLPDASKVLSGTQIPEYVSAAGKQIFEQAAELASSEFPAFTGPRVATYGDALDAEGNRIQIGTTETGEPIFQQERLTADERAAADILRGGTETYQSFIDDASAMADTLGQGFQASTQEELLGDPFSIETAQPFLDVFQRSVDPAIEEVRRQTQQNLIQDRAAAARAGAFGGSRLGLQEATSIAEGARTAGDIRLEAGARGLDFASQRFDQERSARLAAEDARRAGFETDEASRLRATETLQGFAPLVQGLAEQAASGLITAGQAQRTLDQQALDLAYQDYVEQREFPFQMLNFALGALQGVPYETRTFGLESGQQFIQQPSVYGQTIGGLGSLASAYYLANR